MLGREKYSKYFKLKQYYFNSVTLIFNFAFVKLQIILKFSLTVECSTKVGNIYNFNQSVWPLNFDADPGSGLEKNGSGSRSLGFIQ